MRWSWAESPLDAVEQQPQRRTTINRAVRLTDAGHSGLTTVFGLRVSRQTIS